MTKERWWRLFITVLLPLDHDDGVCFMSPIRKEYNFAFKIAPESWMRDCTVVWQSTKWRSNVNWGREKFSLPKRIFWLKDMPRHAWNVDFAALGTFWVRVLGWTRRRCLAQSRVAALLKPVVLLLLLVAPCPPCLPAIAPHHPPWVSQSFPAPARPLLSGQRDRTLHMRETKTRGETHQEMMGGLALVRRFGGLFLPTRTTRVCWPAAAPVAAAPLLCSARAAVTTSRKRHSGLLTRSPPRSQNVAKLVGL